ncbi:MAG TPA: hypothetical protein VLV55_06765 [Rhizomicrobium sp.]|nr:hypothetical protein [Rhizomicrobium sp.]
MAQTSPAAPKPVRRRGTGSARSSRSHVDWAIHARTTVLDAQRYTRFVGIMKRALLLAAAALLLAVLAYSLQPRDSGRYTMAFQYLEKLANDLAMLRPHLTGTDGDGNPFVITADLAVQDPHHLHRAKLSNIDADLTDKGRAWYTMNSPHGFLDTDAQKLWLDGNLSLYSDSGYELHTTAAFVDLAPSCDPVTGKGPPPRPGKPRGRCARVTVRGNRPVHGQGPLGTFRADRFHIERPTKHLYLDGHVAMRIYPSQGSSNTSSGKTPKKS